MNIFPRRKSIPRLYFFPSVWTDDKKHGKNCTLNDPSSLQKSSKVLIYYIYYRYTYFSIFLIDCLFDFYFIKTVSFSDAVDVPDVFFSHNYYIHEIEMLFHTSAISDWFFKFFSPLNRGTTDGAGVNHVIT